MANKKFGYDIKVNYGNIHDDTKKVISGLNELDKAIGRLKNVKDISINVKAGGDQFKKLTEYAAQLDRSLKTASDSGDKLTGSLGRVVSQFSNVRDMTQGVSKEVTDASRNIEKLGQALQRSTMVAKEQSFSGQIASLKRQAEENYRQNFTSNPLAYAQNAKALNAELQHLYKAQRAVNEATKENIGLLKQWGIDTENVGHRLGYLATRMVASFALDKTIQSFTQMAYVEKDMAGFAQVMKHGTGATNAFARSLIEVDPSHMVNGLQLTGEEAKHFKHELEDMQGKLQSLAVKYGTTSHEMIESAKLWGRAYKDNNIVLALTDAATKLAVADAFDIVSANKALESSIMQWGFQIKNANDAMSVSNRIVDSWTALAHNYTVSAQTLAEANKRMAQSAAEVGVSFHSAQALVSVMARKTQAEGGEIGNALKSIFGSIHSKKAIKALQEFGIEVYKVGENGERSFRKVDDVLLDLMIKAQGSKESMEDLLKAISGGKWQWNKADAMLDLNEYLEALRQSSASMGFTNAQVGMQLDTISAKLKSLSAQWEKVITGTGNISWIIKGLLDGVVALLKWLDELPKSAFLLGVAMTGLLMVHREFGNVFRILKTSVVTGWMQMTASANKYARAARIASASTGGLGGKMASVGGVFTGVGRAIGSATAFMGGWVGIAIVAADVAFSLYESYRFSNEEIQKTVEHNQQLLQQHQELYGRMAESQQVVSQFISVYSALNTKLAEYKQAGQDVTEIENQMKLAKEGIVQILGEENTEWILNADSVEESNNRSKEAIQKKKEQLEKAIEAEKMTLLESAKSVRQQARDNLASLKEEKKGWADRVMVMYHFADAIGVAKEAYYGLMQLLNQQRASDALKNSVAMGEALHDMRTAKKEAIERGASQAEISDFDAKIARAEEGMANIEKELYDARYNANYYKDEYAKHIQSIAAKIVADEQKQLGDINSALYGNGHGSSDAIGGGTTGDYPRSELPDGAGADSNKKGKSSKSKKEKNPYYQTPEGEAIDFLLKQGFTANQAYGIVGNLMQESSMLPWADNGSRHGLAQWDKNPGGRWEQLVAFANRNGSDPESRATQMAFLVHELQTTEHENWLKVLQHAVNGTPEEFAHYFDMFVERSGGAETANRQAYARQLANSGYGDETKTDAERANKLVEKQKKIDDIALKLAKAQAEMENAMKPKEQADLDKETLALTEKLKGIQKEIDDLIKLNPKANVKSLQETMKKYEATITHRLQDKYRDKDYDEATQMMKDRHENEDLDREIAGISENFWVSDLRTVNRLVEEYTIKAKKYHDMVEAFKRGDSEYTEADIRKTGLELKKLEVQIKKTGNALNKNIKQQTHDVFHGLLFEGKKFKDIWKDLWKQLAEDALKMIFKINDGNGGLFQNLLRKFDKNYQKGINPSLDGNGKNGNNIGGIDESLNQQMMIAQSTRNLDQNFATWMQNTQGGTSWQQATFTDAVIYGNVQGGASDVNLPENATDEKGKTDVSQYINAGMKLAGGTNNKWLNGLGTIAGFAQKFGLLKFASGGSVDKDQLVRVGEGDKKEWIIPTHDKARGRQLLNQAAKDLGVGVTHGIEPKWQHEDTKHGALSDASKRQDRLMNQMVANTTAMTKGMNYMANGGSGTKESIAQPVFMKQTLSDQDFLAKYQKLIALGKLKHS